VQIIATDLKIEELAASLSCDPSVNAYMCRECENCKCNTIEIAASYDPYDLVKYLQWKTAADENGSSLSKKLKLSLCKSVRNLPANHGVFCRHAFNICHQYREYRSKCDSLETYECIIHIYLADKYIHKGDLGCSCWGFPPASHFAHLSGVNPRQQGISILHHIRFTIVRPLWNPVLSSTCDPMDNTVSVL